MTLHLIGEDLLLCLITMLEEFLDDIIAKYVCHQLDGIWLDLAEDLILLVGIGRLQFLLNEPRAILVATELNHMSVNVLA